MKEVGLLISINRRPSGDNFSIRNLANSRNDRWTENSKVCQKTLCKAM